jgi:hypothetical protein
MQLSDIELAIIFEMAQNSPDLTHINGVRFAFRLFVAFLPSSA